MITQTKIGLNSRSEANPFNEDGFLPLITAPMYSVVDESNYQLFLDNKVQVCLPRGLGKTKNNFDTSYPMFVSLSLDEFEEQYINDKTPLNGFTKKVCIDTANGNIPNLHDFIREAKQIHGNNLIIMAGNVGSVEAFVELAKTGCDYIRVGIGGGGGCNTTSNTGVGQYDLHDLITFCKYPIEDAIKTLKQIKEEGKSEFYQRHGFGSSVGTSLIETHYNDTVIMSKVKIVADGISSYINYCQKEYNFNDNGYAAINKLLHAGADLVMVGSIFAQCLESAGEKKKYSPTYLSEHIRENYYIKNPDELDHSWYIWDVKLQGMSTEEAQKRYKTPATTSQMAIIDFQTGTSEVIGDPIHYYGNKIKPSEGKTTWIPVKWTLNEWLYGSGTDKLPGFVNMLKSAMAYLGATTLDEISKNNY